MQRRKTHIFQDQSWITAAGAYEDGAVIAAFTDEGPTESEIDEMDETAQSYIHINNLLLESDYYGRKNAEK